MTDRQVKLLAQTFHHTTLVEPAMGTLAFYCEGPRSLRLLL
jgi:hypothetical protein